MDADADVEDIGLDAKRIDDVVAAYDAVEDHEDRAEDYFYDFSGNKENNFVDGEAQNSFSGDDDDDKLLRYHQQTSLLHLALIIKSISTIITLFII